MDIEDLKLTKALILTIGIVVGLWHLSMAFRITFVFGKNEPLSSWVIVLAGPFSTLPASLLALFLARAAGAWLVCGAAVSFFVHVAAWGGRKDGEWLVSILLFYIGPMLALGLFLTVVGWAIDKKVGRGRRGEFWLLSGGGISLATVAAAWAAYRGTNSLLMILIPYIAALLAAIISRIVEGTIEKRAGHPG